MCVRVFREEIRDNNIIIINEDEELFLFLKIYLFFQLKRFSLSTFDVASFSKSKNESKIKITEIKEKII